jgi:hypothetical protein
MYVQTVYIYIQSIPISAQRDIVPSYPSHPHNLYKSLSVHVDHPIRSMRVILVALVALAAIVSAQDPGCGTVGQVCLDNGSPAGCCTLSDGYTTCVNGALQFTACSVGTSCFGTTDGVLCI